LGKSQQDLGLIIDENNILPRYIVDDVPVYDLLQLTDAAVLLRPVSPTNDHLLRAASAQTGDSANLVRAAEDSE
jgi:hypothetical protein